MPRSATGYLLLILVMLLTLPACTGNRKGQSVPPGDAYVEAGELSQKLDGPLSSFRSTGEKKAIRLQVIALYTEAIDQLADPTSAYINRGNMYFELKRYDHAIADYTTALRLSPDASDALKNRGIAYEYKGDLANAVTDFEQFLAAIDTAPTERRAWERELFAKKVTKLRDSMVERVN
jgi:tetratricopeptide (TPR) repeat protein